MAKIANGGGMDKEKDKALLRAALDAGKFYEMIGEKMDIEMKDRHECCDVIEKNVYFGLFSAVTLPLYSAWMALFVWPGANYLATVLNIATPGYLGCVGMVAIVAVIVRTVKGYKT